MIPTLELRWLDHGYPNEKPHTLQQAFIADKDAGLTYIAMSPSSKLDVNMGWFAGTAGCGWQWRPKVKIWIDVPIVHHSQQT